MKKILLGAALGVGGVSAVGLGVYAIYKGWLPSD